MRFFFQAEDGIRDLTVTGVQTCALPISRPEEPTRNCRLVVQAVPFARELLRTAGHIYRLCLPRGVQTQRPGCVDLCVLVGLGFPGACYLSLAKVVHEGMSGNN